MTTYPYNTAVPNGPNDPADDQPLMLTNTSSINALIAVNHVGFNAANGGIHNIVQFQNQGSTDPAPAAFGQVYTKTVGADVQLFYESALGIIEQITGGSSSGATGYVLLPGGFIMQWGTFVNSTGNNTISFTPNFTSGVFWVGAFQVKNDTGLRSFTHTYNQTISGCVIQFANIGGNLDTGSFTVQWLAIGK